MLSKTDELYAQVLQTLPPVERLRLASLVLRDYLQQNKMVGTESILADRPSESFSPAVLETIAENLEDYGLNRAMDEAAQTPLLDRAAALQFLEQDAIELYRVLHRKDFYRYFP
jgi:hypothetical protein